MPSNMLYLQLPPEEIALSGPHVWPKITADRAVDRFIFRRPELAYLTAKRRMIEHRTELGQDPYPILMGVRYRRVYYSGGRREKNSMRRFGHNIDHDDPEKDVREFLENLRRILVRYMPDQILVNCSVQLRFFDYDNKEKELLAWQERWL